MRIILLSLFLLFTQGIKAQDIEKLWQETENTLPAIIGQYKQLDQQLKTAQTKKENDCFMLQKSGEYIISQKGKNVLSLIEEIPVINLADETTRTYIEKYKADKFADYYFMIEALKKGDSFEQARDGLSVSTAFPIRALNENDYHKLEQIFCGNHEYLQKIYLKKMKFVFSNNGCTKGIARLKPMIEEHVPASDLKSEILSLYNEYEKLGKGQPTPEFSLQDASGKQYNISQFYGKIVVIDVWATWCCSCIEKMPEYIKLQKDFQEENIVFLTISIDKSNAREKWIKALEENEMTGMVNLITLENSSFENNYCIAGVPRYIIIDSEGNISNAFAPSPAEGLKEAINKTVQECKSWGTNFEDLAFQEALAKTHGTGKKLFIDCYTKTCIPCKYMVKFIFPLKKCGDYFNSNYVCIKKDMEEGDGLDIAKKYNIRIYPTFLIINEDGSLYAKMEGGAVSNPRIDFVKKIKDLVRFTELHNLQVTNKLDATSLPEYITLLQKQPNPLFIQNTLAAIFIPMGIDHLCEPANWEVIKNVCSNIDSPLFRYVFDNRKAFTERLGKKEIEDKLISTYNYEFQVFAEIDLKKRMTDLKKLEKENYNGALVLRYRMLFFQIINNKDTTQPHVILNILKNGLNNIPDEEDKMKILKELQNFNRIANPTQLKTACTYLQKIKKTLQEKNQGQIQKLIDQFQE